MWGWRTRLKTIDQGTFHCPQCGVDRQYARREARRWFTLFFLPLIPLKRLGQFIQCAACGTQFKESVLTMPTTATLATNLQTATRGIVISVITADGPANEAEKARAVQILQSSVDQAYSPAHLETDLAAAGGFDLHALLAQVGPTLNDFGKERLLSAAVELAAVDGPADERELAVVRQAGEALGMTPNHVNGLIAAVLERTT